MMGGNGNKKEARERASHPFNSALSVICLHAP